LYLELAPEDGNSNRKKSLPLLCWHPCNKLCHFALCLRGIQLPKGFMLKMPGNALLEPPADYHVQSWPFLTIYPKIELRITISSGKTLQKVD